jgi:hypothetical protein
VTLDAALIAAIERELTPADRERIRQIREPTGLPRIQFWNWWLGTGWGGWTTNPADKTVWRKAFAAQQALLAMGEEDAVEAEHGRLDAVYDTPEVVGEFTAKEVVGGSTPHPARIDDRPIHKKMRPLLDAKIHRKPWSAAKRFLGEAQRRDSTVDDASVLKRIVNGYRAWEAAGFPD